MMKKFSSPSTLSVVTGTLGVPNSKYETLSVTSSTLSVEPMKTLSVSITTLSVVPRG
ncbi:MAG: hypothetical protein V1696_02235 [Candidatus Jorgensenbacteria bacterium]